MKREPVFQPVVWDTRGTQPVIRYRANPLVRYLLDEATAGRQCGMNTLVALFDDADPRDLEQFAMLIGYSVSGFGELFYARQTTVARGDAAAAKLRRLRKTAEVTP